MLSATYTVGQSDTAVVRNANGTLVTVSTWQSSEPSIVSINNTGAFQALAVGRAVITARDAQNNILARTHIRVLDPDPTKNYHIE